MSAHWLTTYPPLTGAILRTRQRSNGRGWYRYECKTTRRRGYLLARIRRYIARWGIRGEFLGAAVRHLHPRGSRVVATLHYMVELGELRLVQGGGAHRSPVFSV